MKIENSKLKIFLSDLALYICIVFSTSGLIVLGYVEQRYVNSYSKSEFAKTSIAYIMAQDEMEEVYNYYKLVYTAQSDEEKVKYMNFLDSNYFCDDSELCYSIFINNMLVYTNVPTDSISTYITTYENSIPKKTDESNKVTESHSYIQNYGENEYNYDDIQIQGFLKSNLNKNGKFYKVKEKYDLIKNNKNLILIISVASMLIGILIFIYRLSLAGKNKFGKLEISWMDRVPFEGLLIIDIVLLLPSMNAYWTLGYRYEHSIHPKEVVFLILVLSFLYLITLYIFVTTVSRIKNKCFIKNTLFYIGLHIIVLPVKYIIEHFKEKTRIVLYVVVAVVKDVIAVFLIISTHSAMFFIIWLIIKALESVFILYELTVYSQIKESAKQIMNGKNNSNLDTEKMFGTLKEHAQYLNHISEGLDKAVADKMKSEQLKTELITNVSHDIKTPLTSIINYIDLLKKQNIEDETAKEYIKVIDRQALRLKKLTQDLIEASKAATGNIQVKLESVNIDEILNQAIGEYEERFIKCKLHVVKSDLQSNLYVLADGRLLWRVIDNLLSNVCKYSLEDTRVYIDVKENQEYILIQFKNISKYSLNISEEELFKRFVRGDSSRTIQGNGLGLSIAKSLIQLQNGDMTLKIDGDLFKAELRLSKHNEMMEEKNDRG